MKCVGCGAQIDMDQQVCPYCGRVNDLALQRSMHLENLEERNRREGKEIVEKSRMEIFCRIHRWVNVGLAVAVVIAAVASFGFFYYYEYGFSFDKAKPGEIRALYEAKDFGELYYAMSKGDYFGEQDFVDCAQAALYWHTYISCQDHFARAYQQYVKEGTYDSYDLEQCVREGLTCYAYFNPDSSYAAEDVCWKNAEMTKDYQEKVTILLTGILQIPEEMLQDIRKDDDQRRQEIVDHVLEVLPNEE